MSAIALVSCAEALDLDEDLAPLVAAAGRIGMHAKPVAWDDPDVEWSRYDAAVLRSAWDYPPRRDEFLAWAERTAIMTRLFNPPPVVRWNTDKRYLADLTDAGVEVTPTSFIEPGDDFTRPETEFVVKPAISAGARDTARYLPDQSATAREHIAMLHAAGRTVMVQPYLHAIETARETGLVYIDGVYSHAFTKGPLLRPGGGLVDALFAEEDIAPTVVGAGTAERRVADAAVAEAQRRFGRLLYGRVDVVPIAPGRPVVLELEVAEPSLYHAAAPASADRLARAIARRLTD